MKNKKLPVESLGGELEFEILIRVSSLGQSINISVVKGKPLNDLKVLSVLEFAKLNYYNDRYPKNKPK